MNEFAEKYGTCCRFLEHLWIQGPVVLKNTTSAGLTPGSDLKKCRKGLHLDVHLVIINGNPQSAGLVIPEVSQAQGGKSDEK
ncbi:MAG TPA: hypothetical protein PKI62_07860 [bacterium]|nr:hypothetical protein [bacterium]HPR88244.1 hypothetical protein [bacterium]